MEIKPELAEEFDPDRCASTSAAGPCKFKAVVIGEGLRGRFCKGHGGGAEITRQSEKRVFDYNFGRWQSRIRAHSTSGRTKSVRAELGVLRVLLEERVRRISNECELVTATAPVAALIEQIRKTVESCVRLEQKAGLTLDKSQIVSIADQILQVLLMNTEMLDLTEEVKESFLSKVTDGITDAIEAVTPDTD